MYTWLIAIGKLVEAGRKERNSRRGKHADMKWKENMREYDHWKEREWEKRGAQVAHTWCTVVREVRFLSTSLQFYRSGRVSLCLYIYIQGDPRNTRFLSPIGLTMAVSTCINDGMWRTIVCSSSGFDELMKFCKCIWNINCI